MGDAADTGDDAGVLALADRKYQDRNWMTAAALYRALLARNPTLAQHQAVPIALGHCMIELSPDADPLALAADLVATVPPAARFPKIGGLRIRALDLCRAGDFTRAQRVLRFLASFDMFFAEVYRDGFIKGRSGCWEPYLDGAAAEPGFLQANRWAEADLAAMKRRFRGSRVLLVMPWPAPYAPGDRYKRSAEAFGLTVRMVDVNALVGDYAPADVAARLDQQIRDFKPDVIVFNNFTEVSAPNADQVDLLAGRVLETARRELGVRVVESFADAWIVPVAQIADGLGRSIDLVHHCHPLLLQHPALNDPRIYCYFHPVVLPAPTAEAGRIARACSIGSVNFASAARLIWWAEAGLSDLPLDFIETNFIDERMVPPERYADLLCEHQLTVNVSRRSTGVHIVVGRAIETLAVGGVLVEENSVDTRYFLQPGRHYMPFETWADLRELIPWLLGDPARRQRLARDGQDWVRRHFSGDWFWAGLLDRLYAQGSSRI